MSNEYMYEKDCGVDVKNLGESSQVMNLSVKKDLSIISLIEQIYSRYGVVRKGSMSLRTESGRALTLLKNEGVKMIVINEFRNITNQHIRSRRHSLIDWLVWLADELGVSVVVRGDDCSKYEVLERSRFRRIR